MIKSGNSRCSHLRKGSLDHSINLSHPRIQTLFLSIYFFLATGALFLITIHWVYDDPFITYRYAENIREGIGFVYNPGQHVLSTTTPMFALVLSILSLLWSDVQKIANLISAASLATGAIVLYLLAEDYQTRGMKWAMLILYPTFPLLYLTVSSETPLYLALILGAFLSYQRRAYFLTAILSAVAILTRPDGALVPVLLGLHYLVFVRKAIPWKALVVFAAIMLAWFVFSWQYFGSPLPVTLAAKQNQGNMLISERFFAGLPTVLKPYATWNNYLAAALGALGLLGCLLRPPYQRWLLLLAWTVAYFSAYSILGVSRYFWYYAPLVPGFIVLVAAGLDQILLFREKISPRLASIVTLIVFITLFAVLSFSQLRNAWRARSLQDQRIPIYTQAGEWLRQNTAPDATVGTLEVGAIGYYSQRFMVDFAGLIQPDVARQLTANTTYEDAALYAVDTYQPDYIVLFQDTFPRLQAEYINRYCVVAETIESDLMPLNIFSCQWKN